MSVLNFYVL